jgi:hypothetical protein
MWKLLTAVTATAVALATGGTAVAAAPTQVTDVRSFSFVDDEACPFAVATTVDRVRTVTTFDNGDQQRHIRLTVTSSANGNTWVERDAYSVFIDAASPNMWTITGDFTHTRLVGGGTILLQSGRIGYDLETDTVSDPQPGPHGTGSDPDQYTAAMCTALAA